MKPFRTLGSFAFAAIFVLLLAACGGSDAPAAPAAETAVEQAPAAQAPAAKAPETDAKAPAAKAPDAMTEPALGAGLTAPEFTGPTLITDPALFPKTFGEAPQLADLVAAGKLPPVEERLGKEPMVLQPVDSIGKYGGIWRRGFTGPADKWNGYRCCSGPDHNLFWDLNADKPYPNVFKGWEVADNDRTFTFFLREGMKWSDGAPFSTDDYMFWYEDMYNNEDLVPNKTPWFAINGKQGTMEKIDDTTLKITFPEPYPYFLNVLAASTPLGGHAYQGVNAMGMFAPKHYLMQFHPKYAGQETVDKMAKDEGYDNWVNLFKFKNTWSLDPEMPTLAPWVTVTPINTDTWKLERNPYFWIVDSDGNQLPYIDTIILTQAEDLEVINLRAIAGEYDYQARHMNLAKVPVFLQNADKGKYTLAFDPADAGCDACVKFNMSYTEDPEIGKWLANREFRRALAMGIERDQINEVFFLGLGTPGSIAPRENNLYSPGPDSEWRNKWAEFNPDLANQMLDDLGLDKRDAEGYRLRTDNGERLVLEISGRVAQFIEFVQIGEMVGEHWGKNLGIKANTTGLERSLALQLARGGKSQIRVSWGDATVKLFASCGQVFPCNGNSEYGKDLGLWYQTEGEKGTEPDPILKDIMTKYKSAFGLSEEERVALGKEIWAVVVDEVYAAGTVGLSPAAMGVRVYKNDLGNLPAKQFNSPVVKTPGISRPVTWYWKTPENRTRQTLSYEK